MLGKLKAKVKKLLLWSQKYTKTDMLYVATGGSWIVFNQITNSVLSLLLIIAFGNLLPKETYGQYAYILAIAGMLNIATLTGINTAVARTVAQGKTGVLRGTVLYQLKWNVGMLLAFFMLGVYYLVKDETVLAYSFFVLGIFVPSTLACNTYGAYLDGKREFKRVSIFRALTSIVYVSGMLTMLLFSDDVVWLVATYAVTIFCTTLFFYWYTLRKNSHQMDSDVSDTLTYGRQLTYIQFIDPIAAQIDKVIIGHFWGPAQLAIYSLASTIPNKVSELIKSWVNIGFPKFVNKSTREIHVAFYRRITQGVLIGVCVAGLYILCSPIIFATILPQYTESVFYSQILSLIFIFAIPNRYMSLLFSSQGLSRTILRRSIAMSVINISLYVICGTWGGIVGLIIANVLSGCIGFFLNISLWHKVVRSHTLGIVST